MVCLLICYMRVVTVRSWLALLVVCHLYRFSRCTDCCSCPVQVVDHHMSRCWAASWRWWRGDNWLPCWLRSRKDSRVSAGYAMLMSAAKKIHCVWRNVCFPIPITVNDTPSGAPEVIPEEIWWAIIYRTMWCCWVIFSALTLLMLEGWLDLQSHFASHERLLETQHNME